MGSSLYLEGRFDDQDVLRGVENKLEYLNQRLENLSQESSTPEETVNELNQFYTEAISILEKYEDEKLDGPYIRSKGEKNQSSEININASIGGNEAKKPKDMAQIEKNIQYCGDLAQDYTEKLDDMIDKKNIPEEAKLGEDVGRRKPEKELMEDED